MSPVVEVRGLRKNYGATVAVRDVSFTVDEGEIFGILGPNGSGKTTSVECLQGLRRADGGSMRVLGFDPATEAGELRHHVGSQLQDSALPARMRVAEAVELFASFARHPVDIDQLLERWELGDLRDRPFDALSGGQRQRLFIALAFVNSPRLVFLDELTQGLDPQARRATWELIREIRRGGTSVVLVTHFMDEAEQLCDRVAVVDEGTVVAIDTPDGLVEGLGLPSVVRFTTSAPDVGWLEELDVVERVARRNDAVEVLGHGAVLARVAYELVDRGIVPVDLRTERPTLEDAFLHLTGKELHS